jgi:hypothetical protein
MPIENEAKIVLKDLDGVLEWLATRATREIIQIYTPAGARYRKITVQPGAPGETSSSFWFTFKEKLGENLLEHEMPIEARDFDLALPHAVKRLTKRRTSWQAGALHWDVDVLLRADGSPYFGLAEAEMPEGMVFDPAWISTALLPFVHFVVQAADNEIFTNHKLSDEAYAARVTRAYAARPI